MSVPASLDLLAARNIDPAREVYARLFARWPETERLFFRDHDHAIRDHMMFEIVNAALDLADKGYFARGYFAAERIHHVDDLQVNDEQYVAIVAILRDVVRDRLGDDWTAEMETGWADLVAKVEAAR